MDEAILRRSLTYGPVVRAAFTSHGFPPSWGMAIAHHESLFWPNQVNDKGGDAKLGNAWGLCQMTAATAKDLGYKENPQGLLDPKLNCTLAAQLFARNAKALNTRDLAQLAAAYNCGVGHVLHGTVPDETKNAYVPAVLALQKFYANFDQEKLV